MDSSDRLIEIFSQAQVKASPAERERYLTEACQGQPELRQQVEALLGASDRAGDFLAETVKLHPPNAVTEGPGTVVGHYKLLQQIGEGGCGVVYMAEQEEPIRRRVAFKVIKLGMDTKQVIARFEAERQALALMDHPNIAKVFDAGATDTGRPYFVMELVRGIRITDYCDQNNLSTEQRLDLFIQVCHAIQHAHQKGIIHRDIKPSNILVTMNDGVPVPKVIDFGIAKATEQRLTDKTLFTAFEQFIGTPAYMSPEQAEMTSLDIDTRSDIYALGVLLYELLTGQTPFNAKELFAAGVEEMRRIIREKEPVRPSTCISTLNGADQTTVAKRRQSDLPKLIHQVRGDLDWIVMKCLEKDRTRRYDTANAVAQDLNRHLHSEPISAGAPGALYKLQKFGRRHRTALAVASGFVLILLAGSVVSTWQAIRANRNAREQVRQRHLAETARGQVAEALNRMTLQRAEALFTARGSATAVAVLARLLRDNPTNAVAAERLLSALTYRHFALPATDWLRHDGMVGSPKFSPDGQYLATTCSDKTTRVWDAETGQLVHKFEEGEAYVDSTDFTPDGRGLLTVLNGIKGPNRVRLRDLATRRVVREFWHPVESLAGAQLSRDGQRLLTIGHGATAVVWDTAGGQAIATNVWLGDLRRTAISARFSPDGRQILTTCGENTARLWSAETGAVLTELSGHYGPIEWGDFHPDGGRAATLSQDHTVRIWDVKTGKNLKALQVHAGMRRLSYSPDGRWIVAWGVAGGDKAVDVWNSETGGLHHTIRHEAEVFCTAFSPDGQRLATGSLDGTACIWDLETGEPLTEIFRHGAYVTSVQFSPDGRKLATASPDTTARLWHANPGHVLCTALWNQRKWGNLFISFSPDGQCVVSGGGPEALHLDAITGRSLPIPPISHAAMVDSAEFSRDGRRIVTASSDYTARVWDAHSGKALIEPILHSNQVWSAHLSPEGTRLLTFSARADRARLWDAATGSWVRDFQHDGDITSALFSSEGRWVITSSSDKTARLWSTDNGGLLHTFQHAGPVTSAEIGPDDHLVATASEDRTARLWNRTTGAPVGEPLRHGAAVTIVTFSPDGRMVMTVAADMTVRLWDTARGQPLTGALEHPALVSCARFSPDGRRISTGCQDGTVRLWNTQSGLPVSERLQHPAMVNDLQFSPDGQRLGTACNDGAARIWEVPSVPLPVPPWVSHLAEVLAERRFDPQGNLEPASSSLELEAVKRQFSAAPASSVWAQWAKWCFADHALRTISPFSSVTLPDYVQQRIEENTLASLREAVSLSPSNGLALARLARALLHDYPQSNTPQTLEADWYSRRAMQLAPQLLEVLWARAESLDRNDRLPEALDLIARALSQKPADPGFLIWCGAIQEKTNAFDRACEAYSRAAELAGTNTWADCGMRSQALLKRAAILKRQGRFDEARKDLLLAYGIPPRHRDTPRNLLDLSTYYNAGLTLAWDPDRLEGNDLSELPRGQKLAGVAFDLRGLVQLSGSLWRDQYPESVPGIRLAQRCRRLHLLHSARGYLEQDGVPIAKYIVHYRDGQQAEIPVIYGEQIRLWRLRSDSKRETSKAFEAWTGSNPVAGDIRIFKSTWENPRPEEEIAAIDFVSLQRKAAPFLIAVTAEPD